MNVTTVKSQKVWESKDSDRIIWEVTLKGDDGKQYRVKTYSAKISKEGYKGEVKSYVNPKGDRFVRQVPQTTDFGGGKSTYVPRDEASIKAQWAIGQAVTAIQKTDPTVDDDFYNRVEMAAKKFIKMIDVVKKEAANVTQ
jgi:hypothetical protein